jgi:large subunit ribosomal protein L35
MGKKKTRKAVAKRFRRTASGKIKHAHGGKSHLLGHKSRKRKRRLRGTSVLSPSFEKRISVLLAD